MMPSSNTTDTIPTVTPRPMSKGEEALYLTELDQVSGAPMNLRAAVASVRRPAQKLTIIRKAYPDAKPTEDGNWVYTDPKTGRPTLFDEKGKTARDLVEGVPMIGEMVGAIGGGLLGAPAGPPGAIGGAGAGGMLGREVAERGMRAMTGTEDPRTGGQQLGDAATAFGASAVGEGAGRLVAPVGRVISSRLRPVVSAAARAGERLNVPLTAAMRTNNAFFQTIEASLAANPLTTGMMREAGERALAGATAAESKIVQQIGGGQITGRGTFGDALKEAAGRVVQKFNTTREAMDQAIGTVIPGDHLVPLPNVRSVVQQLEAFVAQAPRSLGPEAAPALAQARALLEDAAANNGMVPFAALRNLRTTIGEAAQFGGFGERVPGGKQHLQNLYNGLKQDILNAGQMLDDQAIQSGLPSPGARQAIEAHDAFVRVNRDPTNKVSLETFRKIVEGTNVDNPSAWAQTLAKDPRKAIAMRNQITKMAGPKEWDVIAANIFEDMGRAPAGQQNVAGDLWNPSTFLTNWNKLGDKGRKAIFGGTRYQGSLDAIQDLAEVAMSMKNVSKLTNASQTARTLLVPVMFGGAGSYLSGEGNRNNGFLAGAAIGSYGAGKLLTSPTAIRLISGAVRTAAATPERVGPYIAKLVALGKTDKALGEAITEYLGAAHQAGLPMPNYDGIESLNNSSPASVQFTPR